MEQIENKQQYDKIDPRRINNTNIPIKKQKLSDYIKKQEQLHVVTKDVL